MFNFIFDSKIGEMLAPVVPSNQLFLAIQHHKNDEIPALMLSMDSNSSQKLSEGGYSAIHVSCRYNNRFALELLLSKGVSIELPDNNGNTPLHFAAKYGHVELCKVLLERGSSLSKRNKQNQNAYDISENHIVRQYLLPLVFQAERNQPDPSQQQHAHYPHSQTNQLPVASSGDFGAPVAPSPPAYPAAQAAAPNMMNPFSSAPQQQGLPSAASGGYGAPTYPSPTAAHTPSAPQGAVPPVYHLQSAPPAHQAPTRASGNAPKPVAPSRMFQPDGFHSSASDPELQRKYGHTNIATNIAPPPTDVAFSSSAPYGMYGIQSPSPQQQYGPPPAGGALPLPPSVHQQTVYSRYVPYDPHTNSAAAPPRPLAVQPPAVALPAAVSIMTPSPGGSGSGSQKLLGNKVLPQDANAAAAPVAPAVPIVNVFNPATDCDVIDASVSSSAVM